VTRHWTLRLAAGLAAGAVVLSGCSERQEASDTLPGADASPSASEPELPPLGPPDLPMPAEARTQDAAGAEAFVRYYMDAYNYALRTLNPTALSDLSSNCETCHLLIEQVRDVNARGQRYEGGDVRISEFTTPVINDTEAQFALSLIQSPLSVTADGDAIDGRSYPERSSPASGGLLRWDASRATWLMTQLSVQ
jgi:hypothetical protein